MREPSGEPLASLNEALQREVTERSRSEQRLLVLYNISRILSECGSLTQAAPSLLRTIGTSMAWQWGGLWEVDRKAGVLHCKEMWHAPDVDSVRFDSASRRLTLESGQGLLGRVWQLRRPLCITDAAGADGFVRAAPAAEAGLRGGVAFPILLGEEVLGVIEFFGNEVRETDRDQLSTLLAVGRQVGQFIDRKRAEAALRRSEAYLAEAQRLTRTGSWAWNVARQEFVHWSQEHYRLHGLEPAADPPPWEVAQELIHPDDRAQCAEQIAGAIRDGTTCVLDYRTVLPDGTERYIRSVGHPVFDDAGILVEYIGTEMDVTEQRHAVAERERLLAGERAALADAVAAQRRFRDLVDSIDGIVWEMDLPAFRFTFVSRQAERIIGYPLEEWLSETFWSDHIHPEDRDEAVHFCRKATAECRNHDLEYRMIAADGRAVWVRDIVNVVVDPRTQRATQLRGVMVDITQSRRYATALRESETRYRRIFQSVGVSIWEQDLTRLGAAVDELKEAGVEDFGAYIAENPEFLDRAMRMVETVDVNDATLELLSANSKRELMDSRARIFDPDARPAFAGVLVAIAEGRTSFETETTVRSLTGERLTVLLNITLPDASRPSDRVLMTLTDVTEQKRAVVELQRSERYLAEGQRLSRTGSFGWNTSTGEIYWSDETYRLFAAGTDTIPTVEFILDRTHPADRARVRQSIQRAASGPVDMDFEHRLLLPDGSVRHVHIVARPALPTSEIQEYAGAVMDITDRRRTEAALRESEEQWRAVFENNPTMYFMVDAAGTILSVNAFGAEHLGYSVEELVGSSVLDIFHEADRETVRGHAALCMQQLGASFSWEVRKIRKDGTVIPVRETARAMRRQGRTVLLIACEDVSKRARAEYLTRQVIDSSPDGVSVVGRDYRYERVNPQYERVWNVPAEEIVGMHVADLLGSDVFDQSVKPHLDRCFAGEHVRYGEWFSSPSGRRYILVTYTPLRPDGERVDAALVISHDVTDQMEAAEARREAQVELARVARITTLGEITASIAHEVNQPLAAVVMNGNATRRWLDADPPNLAEARLAVQRIVDDGNRASAVIGRVRALLRRQAPEKARLDINELVRETLALTRSELSRNGVSVRTELRPDLPPVVADRVALQQVLMNLILNGIEAMSAIPLSSRVLILSSRLDSSGQVGIDVEDRGRGLDPDHARRIFEPFFSTRPAGLGLGLSISRSIVEAHGGRLWATSNTPEAGACFHFTVPGELLVRP